MKTRSSHRSVIPPRIAAASAPRVRSGGPALGSRGGFTLVELLLYTIMVGLVFAVATPTLASVSRQMTLEAAATQLQGDLHRVRAEAAKRNAVVDLTRISHTAYVVPGFGTRQLPSGMRFSDGSPDVVRFSSFGPVLAGAGDFRLQLGSQEAVVVVGTAGHAAVR